MKKLLYPIAFTLIAFLFVYSCSAEEEDTAPPPQVQQPTPEPEPPAPTQYTLTVTAGEGGTVSTEGGTYDEGTEVTITATPEEGYEFVGWFNDSGELISDEISYNLEIGANIQLVSNYNLLPITFISKSPEYSLINQTTSKYIKQYYFENYMRRDTHQSLFDFEENSIIYMIQENDGVYYDFDHNGSLDYFGFSYWSYGETGEWGTTPGRYVLIKDYSWGSIEKSFFETEVSFGGKMDLADIDNDGQMDILMYSYNVHQNADFAYNSNLPEQPVELIKIDSNFNYTSSFIGPEVTSHDGASGDVDNDGDIDILLVNFMVSYHDYQNEMYIPLMLLNDGNGNFSEMEIFESTDGFTGCDECFPQIPPNFLDATYYELFDLNNDGFLDFLAGNEFLNNNPIIEDDKLGLNIYWGNGSGKFSQNNYTKIIPNVNGFKLTILGSTFLDLDNDGDLEILTVSTRTEDGNWVSDGGIIDSGANFYENYFLHVFDYNEDSYSDITDLVIDKSYDVSKQNFSHFYDINLRDVDNDGDYDLVPAGTSGWFTFPQLNNLYWENNGGYFSIREEGGYNFDNQ